ncbi:YceI family protein [Flammeovirga pectinis]|uniref:YceI family protein n=1 Tax=Flammeovirga pectinis TaxID=2494373 RepID=A0A3Q9FK01_9BACT|nr:YceI family protein [Flammeovirga pectinis]AZQ61484.1 YceI family protein [Flammeovirga pectinis]
MKKLVITIAAVALSIASFGQKIDQEVSKVNWTAYKVVGSSHTGDIAIKEGSFKIKKGEVKEGEIVIDLSTLNSTDLEGEWKGKLDGHLKSADFFDVEKYPTATFVLKEAVKEGDNHKLKGDLTIKGITQEVVFDSKLQKVDKNHVLVGKIKIDRTKFGLKYGSNSFFDNLGDKAIADEFEIDFKVQTI